MEASGLKVSERSRGRRQERRRKHKSPPSDGCRLFTPSLFKIPAQGNAACSFLIGAVVSSVPESPLRQDRLLVPPIGQDTWTVTRAPTQSLNDGTHLSSTFRGVLINARRPPPRLSCVPLKDKKLSRRPSTGMISQATEPRQVSLISVTVCAPFAQRPADACPLWDSGAGGHLMWLMSATWTKATSTVQPQPRRPRRPAPSQRRPQRLVLPRRLPRRPGLGSGCLDGLASSSAALAVRSPSGVASAARAPSTAALAAPILPPTAPAAHLPLTVLSAPTA